MKAYGYSRHDRLTCKYGCCTFKGDRHRKDRAVVDKAKRKGARRFNCDECVE